MTDAQYLAWLEAPDSIKIVLVEAYANASGTETLFYLANVAYATGAADTPANTQYLPYISGGLTSNESLNTDGSASISYATVSLLNPGGAIDTWFNYTWLNRSIKIYMGDPRWVRSDFRLIFDGVIGANPDGASVTQLDLHILDKLARLNVPISEAVLGGTTNNKDALVPQTFGEVFNITPLLEDPALLKYRYHISAGERCIEVRDNGAPVNFTDTPSGGYFVLNQAAVGTITCSVQGDKQAGVYVNDTVGLVKDLLLNWGPVSTRLSTSDLDLTQLSAFAATHTQPVGLYSQGRTNVLTASQQLASSVGAQIVTSSVGKVRIIQMTASPSGTPTVITGKDFEYQSLVIASKPPIQATFTLGYCQNWTVQATGLAGGLSVANARLFQVQWQSVTSTDATSTALNLLDIAPPQIDTLLLRRSDALTEGARRVTEWKTQRTIYSLKCRAHLLLVELGDALTLSNYRFGLDAGKTGMAVNIERDWLAGRVTIGVLI